MWHLHGSYQIEAQGICHGICRSKREVTLQWAPCEESDHRELEARQLCYRWLREMINALPSDLTPRDLAVEAVSFLTEIAPNAITHRIMQGDVLKELGWLIARGLECEEPPVMLEVDFNSKKM